MEGGIKYCDIAYSRKNRLAGFNSRIVGWIMQRGKGETIPDNILHMLVNDDRFCHLLAAMDDAGLSLLDEEGIRQEVAERRGSCS